MGKASHSSRALLLALLALGAAACSNGPSRASGFVEPDAAVDASVEPMGVDAGSSDDSPQLSFGDVGPAGPPCEGRQCQAVNCAVQGQPETVLEGTVFDPAASLPLYNIYVYVPNGKPDPIEPGSPTCTSCEAPASGHPLIGALTDSSGKFKISKGPKDTWGVPAGDNIPLVLQAGKWRRQIVIPHVDACTTVDLDSLLGKDLLRLPKKSSEGDMPLIAFTSGCDPAECFLEHIGIDKSEFVAPDSASGHVHFYTGQSGSAIAGGNTAADTYKWWENSLNLAKYDIVFNACECDANDRGTAGYSAMHDYLNMGGRVFTTHYYYNWFAPPTGPSDFQTVAAWTPETANTYSNYYIDTTFPKGQAYGQWLAQNGVATPVSGGIQIALNDTRNDVNASGPPSYKSSTRWIYNADKPGGPYSSAYLSFNTPTNKAPGQQCGRAVFSDVHLSGTSDGRLFPSECGAPDPDYAVNEQALEFLFFDLSSCVQDDTQAPPPPPPQ